MPSQRFSSCSVDPPSHPSHPSGDLLTCYDCARSLLDTCPNEGLLVLLRQRGFDVRACGVADAVTCVPNSWLEFYAQRR